MLPAFLSAVRAQTSNQSLGNHHRQRGGNHPACDAHLLQANQRFRRRVGMQGRQHQVPGLGSINGNPGRFTVTDFADIMMSGS